MNNLSIVLRAKRKEKGLSQKELGQKLGLGQTAISNYESGSRLPGYETLVRLADFFNLPLEDLLGSYRNGAVEKKSESHIYDFNLLKIKFMSLLMDEKENEAVQLLDDAAKNDKALISVYEEVLKEALYMTGDMWSKGEIDVAREHYISNVAIKAISHLSMKRRVAQNPEAGRPKALCMSYSSDLHSIGMRIVEEYLDILGYQTLFIGSTATTDSILEMIKASDISLVAISITMDYHLDGLGNFIDILHRHTADKHVKVLVGGQAVNNYAGDTADLGADGYAWDYSSLKELLATHV